MNSLVLTGFALVTLPLLFAIIWALFQIDGFARESEALLATGTVVSSQTRQLDIEVTDMERNARQYQVLENPESTEYIRADMQAIDTLLDQLRASVADPAISEQVDGVRREARLIAQTVRREAPGSAEAATAIARFDSLSVKANELTETANQFIETASRDLRLAAARAQRTLTWQSIAIVPVTLGVILIFTLLIGKPIRALDRAISQLGEGGFSKPIDVDGPSDLRALGRQLEWLRQRLLELAQEKNRFLRHMSHELKTPLANIREGTDLLMDGTVGKLQGAQLEVTLILRSNGLKLQRLIENLLSFSAWQTKSETLALTDFEVMTMLRSVVADHRLQLKSQQIKLHADIDNATINADREMLRTAMDNLLSNAVKFTPSGGDIYLRAYQSRDTFIFEVADTGKGIPTEEKPRIFEPFFQGEGEQNGPLAGTGIGLSVVSECAEAHGGTVELVEGDYSGAHFRLHIPQEKMALQERMVANA